MVPGEPCVASTTAAIRQIEPSTAAIRDVRFTSTPAVPEHPLGGQEAAQSDRTAEAPRRVGKQPTNSYRYEAQILLGKIRSLWYGVLHDRRAASDAGKKAEECGL
jgi:hypothetical protein